MISRIRLVLPTYNDGPSLEALLKRIDLVAEKMKNEEIHVTVVNDASTETVQPKGVWSHLRSVEVVDLVANFGHQRALACGMGLAATRNDFDALILMDGDGEDLPEDIPLLVSAHVSNPHKIVVARRTKRSEGLSFRLSYFVYKLIFRLATGRKINFGNFMLIPAAMADQLLHSQHTGSHIAAAVTRLRAPIHSVGVARGHRIDGRSQMNYVSLVLHGLSAISVFSETVLTRALLFLGSLAGLGALAMLVVAGIRALTDLAVPGWATYVSLALLALIFQALMGALFLTFLSLALRQIPAWIPALHANGAIKGQRRLK